MTTGETWAAARLKPAAPGPPPLPQPSGLPRWGTGWKAGVQPTPKAARAPPPTPIPGRRHVSSPAPPFRAPSFTATRGSTAARKPAEAVGAGQCWGAFVSEKRRQLGQLGEGPGPSPIAPSRAWEALGQQTLHRGTMGTGGRGRGPATQRRPEPRPRRLFLPPGGPLGPPYSLQGGSSKAGTVGVADGPWDTPIHIMWPCLLLGAPTNPEPPSHQALHTWVASSGFLRFTLPTREALRTRDCLLLSSQCSLSKGHQTQRGLSGGRGGSPSVGPCPLYRGKLRHWARKASLEERTP